MIESIRLQYEDGARRGRVQHATDLVIDRPNRASLGAMIAANKAADLAFSGGFKLRKSNLCDGCNTYRSANGSCICP